MLMLEQFGSAMVNFFNEMGLTMIITDFTNTGWKYIAMIAVA